jgi:hypothetical protein
MVLVHPTQPLNFGTHTRHWLTGLRQQLVDTPTPTGSPEETRTWVRQVWVLLHAIDAALPQAGE